MSDNNKVMSIAR